MSLISCILAYCVVQVWNWKSFIILYVKTSVYRLFKFIDKDPTLIEAVIQGKHLFIHNP